MQSTLTTKQQCDPENSRREKALSFAESLKVKAFKDGSSGRNSKTLKKVQKRTKAIAFCYGFCEKF